MSPWQTTSDAANNNRTVQSLVNGITFGLLLALASVGLSLIYGTTGLSNFAHGEQVSLGAVLTYFFTTKQAVSLPLIPVSFSIGWPLIPSALVAIAIAGATGWLQNKFLWAKLRRRRVTHRAADDRQHRSRARAVNFLQWWIGGRRLRSHYECGDEARLRHLRHVEHHHLLTDYLERLSPRCGVLPSTHAARPCHTRRVRQPRAWPRRRESRSTSIIRLVWILATSLAALGGILLALYDQGAKFDAGSRLLLLMFAAVTLGGLGHAFGALVGSLVIGVVTEMSSLWLPPDLKIATALAILSWYCW